MSVAGNEDNDRPRAVPDLVGSDTWGAPVGYATTSAYAGRHHTGSPRPRLRVALGAGVAVLVAVTAIMVLRSPGVAPSGLSGSGLPDLGSLDSGTPVDTGTSGPATTPPGTTRPPVPTTRPTRKPSAPTFATLTFEAEDGGPEITLGGSAWVDDYDGASHGRLVRNLGDWDLRGGPGTLRLNGVVFPTTGAYVITIFFVHPDGETDRTAQLTVSGMAPVTVTFHGNARCCTSKKVTVTIPAGTRSVTLSNQVGHAPSIDRIVISRA